MHSGEKWSLLNLVPKKKGITLFVSAQFAASQQLFSPGQAAFNSFRNVVVMATPKRVSASNNLLPALAAASATLRRLSPNSSLPSSVSAVSVSLGLRRKATMASHHMRIG
jgi:hypothetical protein